MTWEKPTHEELSLACEVSGYANAELELSASEQNLRS
jgi:hypothetical protein